MRLLSLCDRPALGSGRGSDTQSVMRDLPSVQGGAWRLVTAMICPCLPGKSHHKAKSSCESWRGSRTRTGVPFTWYLVCQCAYGPTCLSLYSREDFSWSVHSVAGGGCRHEPRAEKAALPLNPPPLRHSKAYYFSFWNWGGRRIFLN